MKKKKVGIVSLFYKNYNYGGKLQAYALTRFLNENGFEAEQIQYGQSSKSRKQSLQKKIKTVLTSKDYRHAVMQKLLNRIMVKNNQNIETRKETFNTFDRKIQHSHKVYDDTNISECINEYDAFVCGSDQIWNPLFYKKGYFLNFVPQSKLKISYAASISNVFDEEIKKEIQPWLTELDAISVRELKSKKVLESFIQKDVEVTVDPTLLLEKSQWDEITEENIMKSPYIFAYFLGYSKDMRKMATEFAKEKGLQVVTLPHLLACTGRNYFHDLWFGNERLYNAGPKEFVTLIKHADYVMTDSFHATVISIIFQKQFVTFDRVGFSEMGSRISDLLNLFDLENQKVHCKEKTCDVYKKLYTVIQYDIHSTKVSELIEKSKKFLIGNLLKA